VSPQAIGFHGIVDDFNFVGIVIQSQVISATFRIHAFADPLVIRSARGFPLELVFTVRTVIAVGALTFCRVSLAVFTHITVGATTLLIELLLTAVCTLAFTVDGGLL
jgi:hypothetical protein